MGWRIGQTQGVTWVVIFVPFLSLNPCPTNPHKASKQRRENKSELLELEFLFSSLNGQLGFLLPFYFILENVLLQAGLTVFQGRIRAKFNPWGTSRTSLESPAEKPVEGAITAQLLQVVVPQGRDPRIILSRFFFFFQ